ncbi:MAG TPA: LPS export ABC transporter periplasmic protein LptC [bacterium]
MFLSQPIRQRRKDLSVPRRTTGRLSFAALFVCLILAHTGCGKRKADIPSDVSPIPVSELPSQEGWNSSISLTHTGKPQAVIRYGHMAEFESRGVAEFDQGVQVDFFDSEGRHTSRLSAERGLYYRNSEDVVGEGKVVVVSDTGITLYTERMQWNQREQRIVSDGWVSVTTQQRDTLYGMGFESNADLSHWVIKRPRGKTQRRVNLESLESASVRDTTRASRP